VIALIALESNINRLVIKIHFDSFKSLTKRVAKSGKRKRGIILYKSHQ